MAEARSPMEMFGSITVDTDITYDMGTGDKRWRDIYPATLRAGLTATDTLILQARDVDGSAWTTFGTLTSADTPTFVLASAVTGTTQSAADDSTKLATTAYVDNALVLTWSEETPSGTINGSNTAFTLSGTPGTNSLMLFLNGIYQTAGGVDYTLSGTTITYGSAPLTGSAHRVHFTSSSFTWKAETPSGSINDSNTAFTLTSTPATNSLHLFLNGIYQTSGGVDYTLSGTTVTYATAPPTGSAHRTKYTT